MTVEAVLGEGDEENLFGFEMDKGTGFYITYSDKIHGENSQHDRILVNLETDNIEQEVESLEKEGVKKIQDTYHIEGYGKIATFEDPDSNYFQIVQVRPGQNE